MSTSAQSTEPPSAAPNPRRWKRISREQTESPTPDANALLPSPKESIDFIVSHHTAWLATFVVAWLWFANVIAPLAMLEPTPAFTITRATVVQPQTDAAAVFMATGLPPHLSGANSVKVPQADEAANADKESFVLTCALVHTVIVCIGLALGKDLLGHNLVRPLLVFAVGAYLLLCAVVHWAWECKVGQWPLVGEKVFGTNETPFVLLAAGSMTTWLVASMLVPHSGLGRLFTKSTAVHGAIVAAGLAMIALDPPATQCFAIFCGACGAGLAGTFASEFKSTVAVWNL